MSTHHIAAAPASLQPSESLSYESSRFISASPAMRRLLQQIGIVGPHVRIALIEGESGTGKHTLARLIYDRHSARHHEPHQFGFTRCDAREWLLSQTDPQSLTGFIFLDRVDLLAAPGQALLLRIFKDLDFRQPGALVIIASAQSPLRDLACAGRFLPALAHRLASVRLALPPLRERRDDIVPLATVFLNRISAHYHLPPAILTPGAIAQLLEYHWPGNLQELSSILESAVIECSNGSIRAEDLSLSIPRPTPPPVLPSPGLLNLDAVIHHHILHVLDLNRGNKLRAARQLGISRSTLYRILEKRHTFCA